MPTAADDMLTLAIDIGGSGLKILTLDANGGVVTERLRVTTPKRATPKAILKELNGMITQQGKFDRISVGVPGVVTNGVVRTAVNLDRSWVGFDLATALTELTDRPVRVANDADVQGLGVVEGHGVELVLTLGTGMGSALFLNGRLIPNLEIAQHPLRKNKTYEDLVGDAALKRIGKERWSRRVKEAIDMLEQVYNYRLLYLGGGNAKKLETHLPRNVKIVSNLAGLLGGIKLWHD